jgi:hypothetical protein
MPELALLSTGAPLLLGGALVVQHDLDVSQIFTLFGGFSVLGFLLVYGLVALASLRRPLPGNSRCRRWLVGGACLTAVTAMAAVYLSSVIGQQNGMLACFTGLLLVGVFRVFWVRPAVR